MHGTFATMNRTTRRLASASLLACSLASGAFAWSVTGTVKNAAGATLSGVAITVQDSATYKTTSAANGTFTLNSPPVGVEKRGADRSPFHAQLSEGVLLLRTPVDGPLSLALVDAGGRSLWTADIEALQGQARVALPNLLGMRAIFLRVRHAQGVEHLPVNRSGEVASLGPSLAGARALAAFPVLVFKMTGYRDTTFAMTSATATNITVTMKPVDATCDLPTTFKWKDYGKPIVEPKNGWLAVKDFTMVRYNNQYIVYMTYTPAGGGFQAAYMAPFSTFDQANAAAQYVMPNRLPGVAPELIYFTPKKQWVFTTQWCGGGFCYTTGTDPTKPTTFNATTQSLLSENITTVGNPLEGNKGSDTGPIDQVVICDDDKCYLFYNDDNGRTYRASMPKANFPGKFSGSQMILQDTKTRMFEAVEVYKLKGQKKYLMIIECAWTRYFRAFTATDLGGTWTPLGNTREEATPFAGARNVTGGWSTDISHGEIVRTGFDEYREIDPCNLQMIYQGKNGGGDYDKLPYRMGLLTLIK